MEQGGGGLGGWMDRSDFRIAWSNQKVIKEKVLSNKKQTDRVAHEKMHLCTKCNKGGKPENK